MNWKQILKLNQNEVFGLDIGSSSVKIIQLRKDDAKFSVLAAGIAEIASGEKDDRANTANTIRAIKDCVESTSIETRLAVCGVCGPQVAVRSFSFPVLSADEIEGAIQLEAGQVCPFNLNEATVDYQITSRDEKNISGILVAATKTLIAEKTRLAKESSLTNVLVDVDGFALLNCFLECEKPRASSTIAILNVGSFCTDLVIIGENGLPFIRDIACGGNDIINKIKTENSISGDVVKKTLFDPGNHQEIPHELKVKESLAIACNELTINISETLRYYAAQPKNSPIEKIFVCGGFAMVREFIGLLNNKLPAEAVPWNPFDKMAHELDSDSENLLKKKGAVMAVAAGLAMRLA